MLRDLAWVRSGLLLHEKRYHLLYRTVSRISVAVANFFKFPKAWMMPWCHACTRPSVEEIAKVHETFAVAFEPDKSSAVASTTPTRPHKSEHSPPWRHSRSQFSRKPSNFELLADVCECCASRPRSPINK